MSDENDKPDAEGLFTDPVTGFSTYYANIHELESTLKNNHSLGMLYVDLSYLSKIEEKFGTFAYEQIMKNVGEVLKSMKGDAIRSNDVIFLEDVGSPSPMIFLTETRKEKVDRFLTRENVEEVSERVQDFVFSKLFYLVYPYIKERPKVSVGYSFVVNNPLVAPKRMIYALIREAKNIAALQLSRIEIKNKERLQRIILQEDIQTLFQPIVDLSNQEIFAYEALSRGPMGSEYETPIMLFALAKETGLLFELDRLCRKKAIQNARHLPKDRVVFVNTLPTTIHDPEFRGEYLRDFIKDVDLAPENIVFEVTEGAAIENYPLFREAVNYYTEMGIKIAIDDTGTGYSTLESIVEITPQFLKFDISMVRNIDKSMLKQELLRALISIASKIGAKVVGEGIETKEELITLIDLGVDYGQGFLFARPGPAFPEIARFKI